MDSALLPDDERALQDELALLVADLHATLEWESWRGARAVPREKVSVRPPLDEAHPVPAPTAGRREERKVPVPPMPRPRSMEPAAAPSVVAPPPHVRPPPVRPAEAQVGASAALPAAWANYTSGLAGGLLELNKEIQACRACARCEGRTQAMVGEGRTEVGLMVVTTEPGDAEDRANKQLRGSSGDMLDRMLENVLKLRRNQCYVTSLLRCKVPDGETPERRTASLRACRSFLEREIAVVRPKVIMALGPLPTRALVEGDTKFTDVLGQWQVATSARVPVMPTFDLSHLVKSPTDKRTAMGHLLEIQRQLAAQR